jgi:hypothetical protein
MNAIKNILLVSYLKNKGIRRICFILGLIPYLFYIFGHWVYFLDENFINEKYNSFTEFKQKKEYEEVRKKIVFENYPANIGIKNLDTFDGWETFFFDEYGEGKSAREFYKKFCPALLFKGEKEAKKLVIDIYEKEELDEAMNKLKKVCPEMHEYIKQPIKITRYNFLYLLNLVLFLFLIYPPFIFCCIIKWIYKGFKGE